MPDTITPTDLSNEALSRAVEGARAALLRRQRPDGHWVFELEADSTIPAEYVLLENFLDRIDPDLENKIGVYLRAAQGEHGGWPLFHDGCLNLSCSVKAYYALRCIGDSADAPHMVRAREAILAAGGAERTNVFTRAQLALFGQVPWRAVPVMPLEIMHLPLWFPFHLSKVSYWSRTVIVPLLVLMALQPKARNPRGIGVGSCSGRIPSRCAITSAARTSPPGGDSSRHWILLCVSRAHGFRETTAGRHQQVRGIRQATAERRRRAGGNLPRHRQQRDDVRHAGLSR